MKFGAKIIKKEDIWLFLYLCKVVTQTMMKRIALFLILFSLAFNAMADRAWTVRTVPNTRLQSNDIHVSDPDGYLSDSVEVTINTALCAIRDKADVFVVTLSSIGEAEPKRFATELFNDWGVGDAETDNGVLLLFVEDQHALEFETGYGAEETLTDSRCERIFTKTIKPFFKTGDYEGGLCAGVADIVTVYGGEIPLGLKTTLPSQTDYDADDEFDKVGSSLWLGLFGLLLFAMPIVGIVFWLRKRKERKNTVSSAYRSYDENGVTFVDGFSSNWSGSPWEGKGCLGGMLLGLSIFVILLIVVAFTTIRYPNAEQSKLYSWIALVTLLLYLSWVCFRHNQRLLKTAKKMAKKSVNPNSVYRAAFDRPNNKIAFWIAPWLGWIYYLILKKRMNAAEEFRCPQCGQMLSNDNSFRLSEIHEAEAKLEALKFTPYRCPNGHEYVVREHGKRYNKFSTCSKCGAFTSLLTNTVTTRQTSYSQSGEKQETYVCQHCGETILKTLAIPKLVHYSSSSSSGSSSGRSYSSHSSSHHSSTGSFGGGHSGGGGYSGKW